MTYFWPDGQLIEVAADEWWTPLSVTWGGERHQVQTILERWRVDEGWWYTRTWREYFRLITQTGLLAEVFHDLVAGGWYIQRVYD